MNAILSLLFQTGLITYNGAQNFEKIKDVAYLDRQHPRQVGDFYFPEKIDATGHPLVVVIHAGGWSGRDKSEMNGVAQSLASNGYIVYNINHRLAPEFRHPTAIEDLESAVVYAKKHVQRKNIRVSKVALWGYSSGGHMASYYALTRATNPELRVDAVVSGGALYDLTWYDKSPYIYKYLGDYRDQLKQVYIEASPITHVSEKAPPFFLYHALNDSLVEHAQARSFEFILKKNNILVERHNIKYWDHKYAFVFSGEAIKKGILFLNKQLSKNEK